MPKIKQELVADNLDDTNNMDCSIAGDGELSYEELVSRCSEIAHPMSSKKTLGRIRKLIKKG